MKRLSLVIVGFLLSACVSNPPIGTPGSGTGSNYTPVVDGPKNEFYYKDLRECRQLAYQVQQQKEAEAGENTMIGALLGAAIGATDDSDAALAGAVVGGALGGGKQMAEAASSGKTIVNNCMRGRGHNVLL